MLLLLWELLIGEAQHTLVLICVWMYAVCIKMITIRYCWIWDECYGYYYLKSGKERNTVVWDDYNILWNCMELELFHVCGWNLSRPNFGGGESHWNYSSKGAEAGTQAIFKEQWSSCLADAQSSWKGVFGNKGRSQFTERSYMLMKMYSLYSEGSGGAAGRFYLGFAVFLFFPETVVGYLELGWMAYKCIILLCVCVFIRNHGLHHGCL